MTFRSGHSSSFALSALLLLSSVNSGAQTQSDASNAISRPEQVIRSSTRLVQVTAIVQDKHGSPIAGLTKEDFTLVDDGKLQQIAFFAATVRAPANLHPLDPETFTNRAELKGQDPGATIVILFDSLNTSFEDQEYARQHILRFLQSVQPQDHVAIFALTNQLVALHDFTQDTAALANSVARFSPRLLAAYDASHPDNFQVSALAGDPFWKSFEDHVNNANGEIADFHTADRFRSTYAALLSIADYVATIPGHKSLVWVSDGIPIQLGTDRIGIPDRESFRFDRPDSSEAAGSGNLKGLSDVLNRVNMAIYPIDAHGVEVGDSASSFFSRQSVRDSFRVLADNTGGKAFYGTNDIAGAMHSAFDDDRYTYTIGFYPNHGTWDGKFREIKINVGVPGARLRYRAATTLFRNAPQATPSWNPI